HESSHLPTLVADPAPHAGALPLQTLQYLPRRGAGKLQRVSPMAERTKRSGNSHGDGHENLLRVETGVSGFPLRRRLLAAAPMNAATRPGPTPPPESGRTSSQNPARPPRHEAGRFPRDGKDDPGGSDTRQRPPAAG